MKTMALKKTSVRVYLALFLLGMTVLMLTSRPTFAANGDNLSSLNADTSGTQCADSSQVFHVGVGIAFDGTNLLVSCYNDNTVTAINPTNGAQVAIHVISGATSLGALAWDNGRGLLWGCSNFNTVGTIDLSTNVFTPVFNSNGCFDGLAYDASDDSIWASADVAPSVEHYTTTGTLISSNSISGLLGSCGNSGIAVGGPTLYLANDGCSQIYTVAKDFSSSTLFASFPARLEDMECDNITFAGAGKTAMWSKDAYDNILNAWEIPNGSCSFGGGTAQTGRMTGGGTIANTGVRHGFELHCNATQTPNNLEVNWGKGNNFHLDTLTSASCTDDPKISPNPPAAGFDTYTGKGTGSYNGVPGATAEWTFTDAGEPGSNDTATIKIIDANNNVVLDVSGNLKNGNQQAHAQ